MLHKFSKISLFLWPQRWQLTVSLDQAEKHLRTSRPGTEGQENIMRSNIDTMKIISIMLISLAFKRYIG